MDIHDLVALIEKIAPPHGAASWDRCGIQVASHNKGVTCVAVCLDPSPASVERAVALGAQLVVSHHPLLLKGRLPDKLDGYHRVLRTLFMHDVALYAAHTSLDVSVTGGFITTEAKCDAENVAATCFPQIPQGPVAWLFRELGLKNGAVLEAVGTGADGMSLGFGLVGNVPQHYSYDDIVACLRKFMDMSTALVCGDVPRTIRRVAYCAGSGASFAEKALQHGADIFITGDVKYHNALESPLCMLDVGHHGLEEEMMRRFATFLEAQLVDVRVVFVPSVSPLRPALLST